MKVAFLFPGSSPYEALDNWVRTLARHSLRHEVSLVREPPHMNEVDVVFILTEAVTYPWDRVDADKMTLHLRKIPYGVVHNNDREAPGKYLITPGEYPSFCWTKKGEFRLSRYKAVLVRQPVFPPLSAVPLDERISLATFGSIEPKKQTRQMYEWAKERGLEFRAYGPMQLAGHYDDYLEELARAGCKCTFHKWAEKVESLCSPFLSASHFLFVLPQSKGGTGGSPTSPRYAGFFNRPVIVVDDEDTFEQDGYYVYSRLKDIRVEDLSKMTPPCYDWGPDAYLDTLIEKTLAFWRES